MKMSPAGDTALISMFWNRHGEYEDDPRMVGNPLGPEHAEQVEHHTVWEVLAEECAKPLSERRGGELMPCDLKQLLPSAPPPPSPPVSAQGIAPASAAFLGASVASLGFTLAIGIRWKTRQTRARTNTARKSARESARGTVDGARTIGIFTQ